MSRALSPNDADYRATAAACGHIAYPQSAADDVDEDPAFRDRSLHEWELNRLPPAEFRRHCAEVIGQDVARAMADADDAPCRICGGSPENPMHGSKYYSSEVSNQHEYEASDEQRNA